MKLSKNGKGGNFPLPASVIMEPIFCASYWEWCCMETLRALVKVREMPKYICQVEQLAKNQISSLRSLLKSEVLLERNICISGQSSGACLNKFPGNSHLTSIWRRSLSCFLLILLHRIKKNCEFIPYLMKFTTF
jgi:hypothetical protein